MPEQDVVLTWFSKTKTLDFLNINEVSAAAFKNNALYWETQVEAYGLHLNPAVQGRAPMRLWDAWLLQVQGKKRMRKQLLSTPSRKLFFKQAISHLEWTLVPLMLLLLLNYCPGGLHWDNKAELSLFTEKTCMVQLSSLVQIMADLGLGK